MRPSAAKEFRYDRARADDASCSNLRALTRNRRFFLIFYDVNIAKTSKVNSEFSRVSLGEFFLNCEDFEILPPPFTGYFFEKFCQSNSVEWLKIRNHVISVKPSERPHISPLQNVSQNHFHKIGKFKKISPRENQNI